MKRDIYERERGSAQQITSYGLWNWRQDQAKQSHCFWVAILQRNGAMASEFHHHLLYQSSMAPLLQMMLMT